MQGSDGLVEVHLSHARHIGTRTSSQPSPRKAGILALSSIICAARPIDAWKAIWQCTSQTPGLSTLKARIR